jgi:hypothetical protein
MRGCAVPDSWDAKVYRQRAEAWRQRAALAEGKQRAACIVLADGYETLAGLLEEEQQRLGQAPKTDGP